MASHFLKSVSNVILINLYVFLGFCVLAQSGFTVNKDMAQLTAITVVFALIVDYLLLPPILIMIDNFKTKRRASS